MIKIKELFKNNHVQQLLITTIFLIMSFCFLLSSPLHFLKNDVSGTDSSVFRTIAFMMDQGYMPYLNSFDHKGPLIYLLNWIGMKISYFNGIWLVEFINLFIVLCYIYRIARLKCGKMLSILITMVSASQLWLYFEGGNLTEEYAMSFIAISLYYFLDYLLNQNVTIKRLILCGISFSCVFLLRPNMISTWIIFCISIFIACLIDKKYEDLKKFVIFFLVGVAIICIPIITWLGINGALSDFWSECFVFNSLYSSNTLNNRIISFIFFSANPFIVLSFLTMIITSIKSKDSTNISYTIYILITLFLTTLSGRLYKHYGMVFVPLIAYPIAILLKSANLHNKKLYNILISTMVLFVIALPLVKKIYHVYKHNNTTIPVSTICEIVSKKTSKDDSISVFGNWDIIYVMTKRKHATKYSYQFPISEKMPSILDEYFTQLEEEQPKIIVIKNGKYLDEMKEFLKKNHYSLIWQENANIDSSALIFEHH